MKRAPPALSFSSIARDITERKRADEQPRATESPTALLASIVDSPDDANRGAEQTAVSLRVSSIHDAAGKLIGARSIARDIGERKRADEQLRAASIVSTRPDAHAVAGELHAAGLSRKPLRADELLAEVDRHGPRSDGC